MSIGSPIPVEPSVTMIRAARVEESPMTKPTERSMPPVMMTNVSATANRIEMVARWMIFWKLTTSKKPGPVKAKIAIIPNRKKRAQCRPSSLPVLVWTNGVGVSCGICGLGIAHPPKGVFANVTGGRPSPLTCRKSRHFGKIGYW